MSSCRTKLWAGAALFGLLSLMLLMLWPRPVPVEVELRLAGVQPSTNGAWLITVALINGTPRALNAVDDAAGNPAFIFDNGGEYGMWLSDMVNQLKINLPPGGSLTNTMLVTNAPPRFRLKVAVRDLAAERLDWAAIHLLPRRWAEKFERHREKPQPTTAWIETTRQAP